MALFLKRKSPTLTIDNLLAAIEAKGDNGATDLEIAKDLNLPVKVVWAALRKALDSRPLPLRAAYRKQSSGIEAQTSVFFVNPIPAILLE